MSTEIKVKLEKIDPEVEKKLNAILCAKTKASSSQSAEKTNAIAADNQVEDKKSIPTIKSSNEILEELFNVFNAKPPKNILNDEILTRKSKHKKQKKKKKKKNKEKDKHKHSDSSDEEDSTDDENLSSDEEKHTDNKDREKKKQSSSKEKYSRSSSKEKYSSSKQKHKHRSKSKSKERCNSDEDDDDTEMEEGELKSKANAKSSSSFYRSKEETTHEHIKIEISSLKRVVEVKSPRESDSHAKKTRSERDSERDHHKEEKSRERHHRDTHSSRERYQRDKDAHSDRRSHRDNERYSSSRRTSNNHSSEHSRRKSQSDTSLSDEETYLKERHPKRNNFYRGSDRDYWSKRRRSRSRSRSRGRNRSRTRSRSTSRARELGIDKKRLLEIARKNAISMFKRGNLDCYNNMPAEMKEKVLMKMRYSGKTVQDLTDFCKKISNGDQLSDLSSDEDSDVDKGGNTKAFHHPFQLKEREPIVMHIRNSAQQAPLRRLDEQAKAAITMQFPVSSGQQHRKTEAWIPVETKESLPKLPALPAAIPAASIFKKNVENSSNVEKNIFAKTIPKTVEQEPAFKPVAAASSLSTNNLPAAVPVAESAPVATSAAVAAPSTTAVPAATPTGFVAEVPVPSTTNVPPVFPNYVAPPTTDVSNIISNRLNAMRKLQENPHDSEAIKMIYNTQQQMSNWAASKNIPGKFTGSTDAKCLSAQQLSAGPQIWARKDTLTSTKPVSGGMGMTLLQKMGWKPGEGLGRDKSGALQPLLLDVILDKRGLTAKEERPQKANVRLGAAIQDKHPVCLLNELTSKRRWSPPQYNVVQEQGPSHKKVFLFSVTINGQTFTPTAACSTKKEAKMITARFCLQQMGILPAISPEA